MKRNRFEYKVQHESAIFKTLIEVEEKNKFFTDSDSKYLFKSNKQKKKFFSLFLIIADSKLY